MPHRTVRVTPMFTTIRRFHDWQAHVTGDPKRWEAGQTEIEAVGKLMLTLAGSGDVPKPVRTADDVLNDPQPGDRIYLGRWREVCWQAYYVEEDPIVGRLVRYVSWQTDGPSGACSCGVMGGPEWALRQRDSICVPAGADVPT